MRRPDRKGGANSIKVPVVRKCKCHKISAIDAIFSFY